MVYGGLCSESRVYQLYTIGTTLAKRSKRSETLFVEFVEKNQIMQRRNSTMILKLLISKDMKFKVY